MNLQGYTLAELRRLLRATVDVAERAEIETAINAARSTSSTTLKRPESVEVFGKVSSVYLSKGGDLNIKMLTTYGETEKISLTREQQEYVDGEIEEGDCLRARAELCVKGVTQYEDHEGNIKYHGVNIEGMLDGDSYISFNSIPKIIKPKVYKAFKDVELPKPFRKAIKARAKARAERRQEFGQE